MPLAGTLDINHPCPLQERRERLMKEQLEKMRADNPKITEQFADLKRDLAQVGATPGGCS
jgi:hypothetical protein